VTIHQLPVDTDVRVGCRHIRQLEEVPTIMRALDPEVIEPVWTAIKPLVPARVDTHPLGCHRRRLPDRDCFEVMVVRLATGCSWHDAERLCGGKVSDTTVRARRDEWIAAGVLDEVVEEALDSYDKMIGLDFSDVALDGSLHKSPAGGEGTGKNPTDRAKLGWKWSIVTDRNGIPFGFAADGANRNDSVMLAPTLDDAQGHLLLGEIETIWLDRGYDSTATRGSPSASSPTQSSRESASGDRQRRRRTSRWGSAGRSSGPTPGSPILANFAETPIDGPSTGSPSSAWRSCSSSRRS
jgi:transposase